MNTNNFLIQLSIAIVILANLTACNTTATKPEGQVVDKPSDIDLLELRNSADKAYFDNDLVSSGEDYEILVKEMPEEALHWYRLANIYVRTNRPQAAINLYREAVIRDPKYTKAWYNLSVVQLKQTAYSLNEMLHYADETDPLYNKAKDMLDDIKNIIRQD